MAAILLPPAAHASLIGDTISAEWAFTGFPSSGEYSDTAVIGAGTEFISEIGGYFDEADFDADGFWLTYRRSGRSGHFAAKRWTFTDFDLEILNVLPDAGNAAGASVFSFGPDSIQIDLPRLLVAEGQPIVWRFDIITAQVPEPGTLALLGLGLAGLGFARRRKAG